MIRVVIDIKNIKNQNKGKKTEYSQLRLMTVVQWTF